MKSSKWILGLMVVVLMMSLAPSSFAQIQIQIFNTPSPGEIQTGRHVNTSDPTSTGSGILISGSLVASSTLTTTDLRITFPSPITTSGFSNNTLGAGGGAQIPTQDPIRIEGASGVFAGITAITTVNWASGVVTITLPGTLGLGGAGVQVANNQSGSLRLVGVRLDANGKTAPLNASVSLSSSANNYIPPSSPTVALINALGAGIGSLTQATNGTATNTGTMLVFTNNTIGDATASILLTEGFAAAWRTQTQASTSGVPLPNGTNIRLTFSGIPTGGTITAVQTATSTTGRRPAVVLTPASGAVTPPATATSTSNQLTVSFDTTTTGGVTPDLNGIDTVGLQLTLTGAITATPSTTITVVATMIPIGDALDSAGVPTATGGFPRFAQADTAALTIGTIAPATTTLLVPYALSGFGNYNTGIAVANTSADPFTGRGGATATSGPLSFTFYPNAGTGLTTGVGPYSTTTSGRPGGGVDSSGNIVSGSTYAVLLSDLLTAAGRSGDFQGYVFIEANFLNAHGVGYIYQGPTLTSAVPMLVLPPPLSNNRSSGAGVADGVEDLNN